MNIEIRLGPDRLSPDDARSVKAFGGSQSRGNGHNTRYRFVVLPDTGADTTAMADTLIRKYHGPQSWVRILFRPEDTDVPSWVTVQSVRWDIKASPMALARAFYLGALKHAHELCLPIRVIPSARANRDRTGNSGSGNNQETE